MANVIQSGNTGVLTLSALTNSVTGAVDNSATVTAQLYLADGATAVGSPVTLTSLGSAGNYRGTVAASVIDANFVAGDGYRVKYTVVNGSNNGEFNEEGIVQRRGPS